MECFKPTKVTYSYRPLKDMTIRQDSTLIKLNLKDDITPKESAEISIMFSVAVGSAITLGLWDYVGYIKEHGLERHFEFEEVNT